VRAGIDALPVQFKSGAESLASILAGQAHFSIDNVTAVRALVNDKRLRALAVTSTARSAEFPDLPTMIEAGVPDFVITAFFGIVAPAATPRPVIQKLNAVINEGLKSEAMVESLRRLGAQPSPEAPESFQALMLAETRKWVEIANAANIRLD
jgi:tripartite-type tricarboxylate transporter receptor subunit TctC